MGYAQYGDPKGRPLFSFHGWPGSRLHGRHFEKDAKNLKIRIIAPDRPGYGLSDFQPNRTLLDFPDDIAELADKLNFQKFAVLGISGGGPYAAVCAYKIPDRITKAGIIGGLAPTYVKGILRGMNPVSKVIWEHIHRFPGIRSVPALLALIETRLSPFNISSVMLQKLDRTSLTESLKKEAEESRREAFRNGPEATTHDLKLYSQNWGFDLAEIKLPVYLWYGEIDQSVPLSMAKFYTEKIPACTLTVYPGEGHFCHINHIEEILRMLWNPQAGRACGLISNARN